MDGNETSRRIQSTRQVKNPIKKEFDQLAPGTPYAAVPDKPEEEDGTRVNEFVETESFQERDNQTFSYSDESFESEDNDEMEKASDFVEIEQEKPTEEFTMLELGNDIKMRVPKEIETSFDLISACKWTSDEKNKNLFIAKGLKNVKFVTDVFKLTTRSRVGPRAGMGPLQNITNANERKLALQKQCVLSLQDKFKDKILFRVPVEDKFAQYQNRDVTSYKAVIECGGNEWKTIPATLKDGFIEFRCIRLNSFGLASSPKRQDGVVDGTGQSLSTGEDGRLNINFQEGCVSTKQKYQYSIQRPDPEYVKEQKKPEILVAAVSDKLYLQFDESQFQKPISMVATLSSKEETGSDFEEFDVKVITYRDDKPVVINTIVERSGLRQYKMVIDKSSRVLLAALRRDTDYENFKTTLKNELDLFFGHRKLCTIMLFYGKRTGNTVYFVSACCLKSNRETVVNDYAGKGRRLIFESEDILLPPQQRIRIHPVGCIGGPSGPRSNFFLFFMYATKENVCEFTAEISRRMGGSIEAIVEFSADNQMRGNLTRAAFDLDFMYKTNERPRLQRSTSNISKVFKPPSSKPHGLHKTKTSLI